MKCDLKCPFKSEITFCCRGCRLKRKYLKNEYPDKWTNRYGFWSKQGCKLGEDKPQECKDYDCKKYVFYSTTVYVDGRWVTTGVSVIANRKNKEIADKYNALFREYK